MARTARILIVGLSTLDVFLRDTKLPELDGHAYLHEYSLVPGGSAANMAYWMAWLGAQTTLCTRLGRDMAGRLVRDFLRAHHVRLKPLIEDPSRTTGFSVINVGRDGRIGLLHSEGANNALSAADLPWPEMGRYDIVHVGGAMSMNRLDGRPLQRMLVRIRKLGKTTSLHTSRNTDKKERLLGSLPLLDFVFMNNKEAMDISGHRDVPSAAAWLRNLGIPTVAITLGSAGAYVSDSMYSGTVPGFHVSAVDTTGCGDAFTAGFLFAAWQKQHIRERAVLGNALGALCARALGAMPQSLCKTDLNALLKRRASAET